MKKIDIIKQMKHSPLLNYAGVPGLTSWLIGSGENGMVRLLECSRDHFEPVTPHSHRFDFVCEVLAGCVTNVLWKESDDTSIDQYMVTELTYSGKPGEYTRGDHYPAFYRPIETRYAAGETYSMLHDQIHSIFFKRGTSVLFWEGPTISETSLVLEPFIEGDVVPTFEVKDWMFKDPKK
jgi:hypothetical protein